MYENTEFISTVCIEDESLLELIDVSSYNTCLAFYRKFGELTDINRAIKTYRLHIVSILAKAVEEAQICRYQEAIAHIVNMVLKEEAEEDNPHRAYMINSNRFGRTVLLNYIRDTVAVRVPNTRYTFHKELGKRMQAVKTPLIRYVTDAMTARIVFPTAMIRSIKKIGYPEDPTELI